MADSIRGKSIGEVHKEGVGTNAGVTVTVDKTAKASTVLTEAHLSSDLAALVTVTWTSGGVAKTWKKRFSAAFAWDQYWHPGAIVGDTNTDITVAISASSANCEANAAGFIIPGLTGYAGQTLGV